MKISDRLDSRLFAVEAVADDNEGELWMRCPYFCKKPFPCVDLAVLFLLPVCIFYFFRGKGNNLSFIGMDDGGLNDLMEIPGE